MKVTKLSPKQLLIEFPTRKEQILTMCRFSEYSEGKPGIKDTKFSMDEFIDAYSDENGDTKYFSFWDGFNVTKESLLSFAKLFRNQLSKREINFIKLCKDVPLDGHIITCEEGDEETIKHEKAHGLYSTIPAYKIRVDGILNTIDKDVIERFKEGLLEMDYIEDVLMDELHAYLTSYSQEEWDECFTNVKLSEILDAQILLNNLYDEFNS